MTKNCRDCMHLKEDYCRHIGDYIRNGVAGECHAKNCKDYEVAEKRRKG